MKIEIISGKQFKIVDAIVIPIFKNQDINPLLKKYPGVDYFVKREEFKGEIDDNIVFNSIVDKKLYLILGGGDNANCRDAGKLAQNLIKTLKERKIQTALVHFIQDVKLNEEFMINFIDHLFIANYKFTAYLPEAKNKSIDQIDIHCDYEHDLTNALLKERVRIAKSVDMVRDLVNEIPAKITPDYIVDFCGKLALENRLQIKVLRTKELKEQKLNGILAVGQASPFEPALIKLSYTPLEYEKTVTLVGKGLTFDSGGLNIKDAHAMKNMKCDMAGAASVIGIIQAVSDLKLPVRVHAIASVVENLTGNTSYKPGDIISFKNNITVEITDTDAEGRIVLADALLYAIDDKPDYTIELSTLTGWIFTALGDICAGLMGNDKKLTSLLGDSGQAVGELLWELPTFDEYKKDIKSKIASLKNYGYTGAQSIKAGLFLMEFTGNVPFVHIDIAGTAFLSEPNAFYLEEGATGFGVRLLIDFLKKISS